MLVSTLDRTQPAGEIKRGSARGFGIVFTVVFVIVALWPVVFGSGGIRWWAMAIAGTFLGISLIRPSLLEPLNRLWFLFGILLSKIINPLVMTLIFVLTVIPTGIIMRLLGKRPLQLKAGSAQTTWHQTGDKEHTFDNQF